ncbi:MAG: capsular polysaccharide biosynthesis protein [Pseudomonadota bacterium]
MAETPGTDAPTAPSGRLHVYTAGFLSPRLRRVLSLAGWRLSTGWPGADGHVGVWGASAYAARGEAVAARTGASIVRIEDAFLRSIRTGREGDPPLGLLIDPIGVHFDPTRPSLIEQLCATAALDDTALLDRARLATDRLKRADLSKYNGFDTELEPPEPGYVLVIDQTAGDASVTASGGGQTQFNEMLAFAQIEHPGARIIIKSHPETLAYKRSGYFGLQHEDARTQLCRAPVSPWRLLEGATAVYTYSSQLGFEGILAGHRPRVFGQPFYAGWGLTADEHPHPRRSRKLTRAQLFAAAMILAPTWYDPCRDRLCSIDDVIDHLEARTRAFREDRAGYVATGMSRWKRATLQGFYGGTHPLIFADPPAHAAAEAEKTGRPLLAWASRLSDDLPASVPVRRAEDGFLRSRGLGAELTPPLSLVTDDLGIYYDPTRPSRLEHLVSEAAALPTGALARAERLVSRLAGSGVTKYNVGARRLPDLPAGHRLLVPGQVEDDASIRLGCSGSVHTNLGLLEAARAAFPEAVLIYKPHPDVEAGLRPGHVPPEQVAQFADATLSGVDAATALGVVEGVVTLTSAAGFEALVRGLAVTCFGAPFYSGWGLTDDRAPTPARRRAARPTLAALVHAALIAYPRYRDPVTGLPCPVEVVLDRLEAGSPARRGPLNRGLSVAQGWFASHAHLWR